MGYRSTVAYVVNFKDSNTRDRYIALVKIRNEALVVQALDECLIDKEYPRICFYQEDVKWYDSYPDVKAHTFLYEWAVEVMPDECGYKFVSVGEDNATHETDGGNDEYIEWDLEVVSSIYTPFPQDYADQGKEEPCEPTP